MQCTTEVLISKEFSYYKLYYLKTLEIVFHMNIHYMFNICISILVIELSVLIEFIKHYDTYEDDNLTKANSTLAYDPVILLGKKEVNAKIFKVHDNYNSNSMTNIFRSNKNISLDLNFVTM